MYKNPYIKIKPKSRRPYTEIYLVRHCHPDYSLEKKVGERHMPLSVTGRKQRQYLTKRLLKMGLEVFYSSDLQRSRETAGDFMKKVKKELLINPRLDEIDWRHWQRLKYFNMSEKSRQKKLPRYKFLDKELDKMQIIARRALADIFRRHKHKKIVLFTHGNFIKALLSGILNADIIGFLSMEIFQSSISKIIIDRDGYIKIAVINDVNHLPTPPDQDLFVTLLD